MVALLFGGPAVARDMPGVLTHISIAPPIYYGHQGGTVSIDVRMYHRESYFLAALYRISFSLDYGADDLTFLGATAGPFLSADGTVPVSVEANDHHGTIDVVVRQAPKAKGAYGESSLVTLQFRVERNAKPGDFLMVMHDAQFLGADENFIPGVVRSGQFVVRPATAGAEVDASASAEAIPGHHHHLIPAVPNWLFWSGAAATILVTFVIALIFVRHRPDAPYPTYDLLGRMRWLRRLLAHRRARLIFSLPATLFVLVVLAAGLLGPRTPDNLAPYLTWSVWWVFIIFVVALIGNIGGIACPWENLAFWIARHLSGRRQGGTLSLERPWPRRLHNVWLAAIFFLGFIWLDLVTRLSLSPLWTVSFWLVMLLATSAGMLIFDRASWCRYGCPFGRIFGLYSMFAGVEVRARDKAICAGCATVDCYNGNDRGDPCPTFLSLATLDSNRSCIGCLECVRTCPADNVAINLRPLGAEFLRPIEARADEGVLVVLSLYAISVHSLTLTPAWAPVTRFLVGTFGSFGVLWTRTIEILLPLPLFFGFFFASAWLSALLSGRTGDRTRIMLVFVYCLLPIALSYHLAHNLGHMAADLPEMLRLIGKSLSMKWRIDQPLFDMQTVWYGSIFLILTGHVVAVYLGHKTSVWLYDERRSVIMSQIPVLGVMVAYTLFSLWLVTQPLLDAGLL